MIHVAWVVAQDWPGGARTRTIISQNCRIPASGMARRGPGLKGSLAARQVFRAFLLTGP